MGDGVRRGVEAILPGQHVCAIYETAEERFAALVPFVIEGLARNRTCVCVATEGDDVALPDVLQRAGLDVAELARTGRLTIVAGGPDVHRTADALDPLQAVDGIVKLTNEALARGASALQLVGEMSWVLGRDPHVQGLAAFEARVTGVSPELPAAMLCQYHRARFTPEVLREMIAIHPLLIVGDTLCRNPYHVPVELYLSPDWRDHETSWLLGNLHRLQTAEDALVQSRDRYHTLSRSLLEIQEEERRSLARDLHDQIGQDLVAARLNLQAAGAPRVDDALMIIERLQKGVQTLAFTLRPSALDDLGLFAAVRRLVAEYVRTGYPVQLSIEPTGDADLRLPPDVEIACFRIVQQGLANAARHASAESVEVWLRTEAGELVAEVHDDGVGFDVDLLRTSPVHARLGLLGMEERAALGGGRLQLESEPGSGTRVRARFPLGAVAPDR
jgi:signal transduction histidine kinase